MAQSAKPLGRPDHDMMPIRAAIAREHVSIGLDTSVVLRLLTDEPAADARLAALASNVLMRRPRALHHHYGLAKKEARSCLRRMAGSGIETPVPPQAVSALDLGPEPALPTGSFTPLTALEGRHHADSRQEDVRARGRRPSWTRVDDSPRRLLRLASEADRKTQFAAHSAQ